MIVKQYACVEIAVGKQQAVQITDPEGNCFQRYSFEKQPVKFLYDDMGLETVEALGEAIWCIRFYPEKTGHYVVHLEQEEIPVEVEPADCHGYVVVSPKDPRYFAYSDGTPWFPMGINLTYPTPVRLWDQGEFKSNGGNGFMGLQEYDRWFRQCSENGVNLVRLWLGHPYFNPDTEDAEVFDNLQWSKIDAVVALAETYGIKLKLTVEQFRFFDYDREDHSGSFDAHVFNLFRKKLYYRGRRCESASEWLTEELWQNCWLNKLQQLANRVEGNPAVFCIELWNEMNAVRAGGVPEWNYLMLPKVKAIFPKQLVVNSLGSDCQLYGPRYQDFFWSIMPFQQFHRYLDCGSPFEVSHGDPLDFQYDAVKSWATPDKPFVMAETGAVNPNHSGPFAYYSGDHRGMIFCDCVYVPLFSGAASCGHIWHWGQTYVESKNLYPYFKPLTQLIDGIAFDDEQFVSERYDTEKVSLILLRGKQHCIGYLRNRADNWRRVLRDNGMPMPVDETLNVSIPVQPEVKQIWSDETGTVSCEENSLQIENLKYGCLLRWNME